MEINLTAPTNWATLTEQQVVYVAQVLSQQPTKEELLVRCLLKFTGLRTVPVTKLMHKLATLANHPVPNYFRYKRQKVELSAEQIQSFCTQLAYLCEQPGLMACPSQIAGLHGPDEQLWKTTFEEYLMADRYYRAYSRARENQDFLYSMVGVLWRKKGLAYSDGLVDRNARRIRRKAKAAECAAVFLWWTGVKLWLRDKYPDLFTGSGDAVPDADESDMVMSMLNAVTEGRAHENKQVYTTPVHEVLHSLNAKSKQIHELNAKYK